MELLHTEAEINYFDNLHKQSFKLRELGDKFDNKELIDLADKYDKVIKSELSKYNSYIGKECLAPPSSLSKTSEYRLGKITGNFYFNSYSKSVRCDFKYSSGGFDTHAIKDLK